MGSKQMYMFGLLLVLVIVTSGLLAGLSEAADYDTVAPPAAVYVFGDSLVDVGNNNHLQLSIAKANFPHNGMDFPTKLATGRFSNGKNAADFLSEKLGLPTSPPYLSVRSKSNRVDAFLTGVSFASGGAGIFDGNDLKYRQSIPLTLQVSYYSSVHQEILQNLGSAGAQTHLSKSIFAVVIGSNDVFGYNNSSKQTTPQQYADQMLLALKGQLKMIYDLGGRKYVVTGLGPIGCCPKQRSDNRLEQCNEEMNNLAQKYNTGLRSLLQEMKSEYNDINYVYFDTYSVLLSFIQTPASHGFTQVKAACCGLGKLNANVPCLPIAQFCPNRTNHVFWDLYHPTEASSRKFVDIIYDGPPSLAYPINVKQLVEL